MNEATDETLRMAPWPRSRMAAGGVAKHAAPRGRARRTRPPPARCRCEERALEPRAGVVDEQVDRARRRPRAARRPCRCSARSDRSATSISTATECVGRSRPARSRAGPGRGRRARGRALAARGVGRRRADAGGGAGDECSAHDATVGARPHRVACVRIATWNVNSIRSRIDRVEAWLARSDVDVLPSRRPRPRTSSSPSTASQALGYEVAHHGINQWNGVAILSRVGTRRRAGRLPVTPAWGDPPVAEARSLEGDLRRRPGVVGLRPQRAPLEDPHMVYKLDWLARLRDRRSTRSAAGGTAAIMRRLEHRAAGRGRLVDGVLPRQEPRLPRRARRLQGLPRGRVRRRGAPAHARARASTPTGTTSGSPSRSGAACASTSSWAHRRSPPGSPVRPSTARSARARAPPTTRRSWSSWR